MGRYYFYTVGSYFGITFWDVDEVFGRWLPKIWSSLRDNSHSTQIVSLSFIL